MLEGLGHRVEEIDDRESATGSTMWWGYVSQWIGSRAQFRTMARAAGSTAEALAKTCSAR